MTGSISFAATGDSLISRRLPANDQAYREVASIIQQADVRFTNLETTVRRMEGFPSAVSGGSWAMASPEMLGDLLRYGFNLVAWANNHTLDYSYGGLEATENYLDQHELVHAGAGKDLASASEPRYLETASGRVALIAATASFDPTWMAGEQRPDMIGRPGVNGLRHHVMYTLHRSRLEQLRCIAEASHINDPYILMVQKGYIKEHPEGTVPFGAYLFTEGEHEGASCRLHKGDVDRIVRSIREARRQADYVIVSIHAHQPQGRSFDRPAEFVVEFTRLCIDEGAHAVVGHGPHIVRGIEVYKDRPIFYSLGNFIFQNDSFLRQPADFYEKYGLGHQHRPADAYDARSQHGTTGLAADTEVWQSVIPYWKMRNGKLTELTLYSLELGSGRPRYRRGWPQLAASCEVLTRMAVLSEPYGVTIQIEDGVGKVSW